MKVSCVEAASLASFFELFKRLKLLFAGTAAKQARETENKQKEKKFLHSRVCFMGLFEKMFQVVEFRR
jgi:hypothetical protein